MTSSRHGRRSGRPRYHQNTNALFESTSLNFKTLKTFLKRIRRATDYIIKKKDVDRAIQQSHNNINDSKNKEATNSTIDIGRLD
jgi:hypothetical protein